MIRLLIAIVIGAILAAGTSYLVTSFAAGTGKTPVSETLYGYGTR